jgi:hypothetical protein
MIIESEFIILAVLIFSLTAALWLRANGMPFSLADLTIVQPRTAISSSNAAPKTGSSPFLLPVSPMSVVANFPETVSEQSPERAASIPLDTETQLNRVSFILQNAIDLAAKAERLHNAAHEQLDSAHYALQNLLDELSAVMPGVNGTKPTVAPPPYADAALTRRPAYMTALAA